MKELIIYDFDGFLFKDPWEIHLNLLEKLKKRFPVLRYVILRHGSVPMHLYETEKGKEYLKIFTDEYFNQKMPKRFISELTKLSKKYDLVIASYNKKKQIVRLLDQSNIAHLFKHVFAREDFKKKEEVFLLPFIKKYDSVIFITDTISDILEVKSSGANIQIYGVDSIHCKRSEFLKYIPDENILKPFFEREKFNQR